MLVVFVRSIILYIALLISLRVMGKGEIAEMNCYDLVITFLLAEVAAFPMENNSTPIINGIAAISGLVMMQTLVSYLTLKSKRVKVVLSGKPSILVDKGKIMYKELKKERISIDELLEQLRVEGYFRIKDVQYAILETDGNLSILPSTSYEAEPTLNYKHLPLSLVLDGNIIKENLNIAGRDTSWLKGIIKSYHINDISEILICVLDENDKIYIQKK